MLLWCSEIDFNTVNIVNFTPNGVLSSSAATSAETISTDSLDPLNSKGFLYGHTKIDTLHQCTSMMGI